MGGTPSSQSDASCCLIRSFSAQLASLPVGLVALVLFLYDGQLPEDILRHARRAPPPASSTASTFPPFPSVCRASLPGPQLPAGPRGRRQPVADAGPGAGQRRATRQAAGTAVPRRSAADPTWGALSAPSSLSLSLRFSSDRHEAAAQPGGLRPPSPQTTGADGSGSALVRNGDGFVNFQKGNTPNPSPLSSV